jgi:Cu(I)/Ag(I) efflux system membrane fusion protein
MSGRSRTLAFVVIITAAFLAGYLVRGGGSGDTGEPSVADGHAAAEVWTCSMHPQIRLPEAGKCPICFMDLIPVEQGGGRDHGDRRLAMSESAIRLAEIETRPAERRPAESVIRTTGSVTFDETRISEITSWVPGRIEKLLVNFTGTAVRRGDPIAEIYSPVLVSAQEELIQARRAYDASSGESATASSTLDAVREKLRQYGLTDRQIEAVETEGRVSRRMMTYAPSSGVVVGLSAKEGQYVETGTTLMRIADLSMVWVTLRAFQSDLSLVQPGQRVSFKSTALPGETFEGEVVFVDPVLDPKTRTAGVRAVASNEEGRLRPDMFVTGEIRVPLGGDGKDPLVIPASAPLLTGKRAVVYVRLPGEGEPVFEGREVVLGARAGDYYVVLSGLEEGELVVVSGAFKIDSELQIRAKGSMMSPDGGSPPPGHDHGGRAPRVGSVHAGAAALAALGPLYDAYFDVQMDLAGDDHAGAVSAYADLKKKTQSVDMALFEGEAHRVWMDLSGKIVRHSGDGAASNDITGARDAFYHLSKAVIELHESFGHSGDDFFLTFCPMARDNKGAFWIQEVDTVYNSFYGAMMLRCGSIEGKLPPAGDEEK